MQLQVPRYKAQCKRMASIAGAELNSMEILPAEQRGTYHRIGLRVATAAQWPVLIELLRAD